LRTTSETIEVGNRWKPDEKIPIGWTAGAIGDSLCFAAFPGEPFIEHQLALRSRSTCGNTMLFGYSYSVGGVWAGYLPTIRAAVEGGYGADYNASVEVGTGELLVNRAAVALFRLRGLLKDSPGSPH